MAKGLRLKKSNVSKMFPKKTVIKTATSKSNSLKSPKFSKSLNPNPYPKETTEQILFIEWLTIHGIKVSASANGGKRNIIEAVKLKRMGVAAGFPDLEINIPRGQYHGLFIEMKRQKGGQLSIKQIEWHRYLREQGYCVEVAKGFEHAKEIMIKYMALGEFHRCDRCFHR